MAKLPSRDDLKARREAAGLTLVEVGEILGVSDATVCYWEIGRSRVAAQYERDLDALYSAREAGQAVPEELRQRVARREAMKAALQRAGQPVPRQRTLDRAARALAYIRSYVKAHGHSPTMAEVGTALGSPHPGSTGQQMVDLLIRMGHLAQDGHGPQFRGNFVLTERGGGA